MAERDTRFGGNMERANVGEQYSRPRQTETPNFGGRQYLDYLRGQNKQYQGELDRVNRDIDKTRMHPLFPDPGPWNEFSPTPWNELGSGRTPHPNPRMRGMGGGLESLESKIDLNDIFNRFPGMNMWRLIQDLDKRGIEYAGNDTGLGSTDEYQMAKVYTNQDPGMIDEGFFWDSVAPQGESINKVLDMPGIEGMRQGSESDWNYDDYNKMIPDWLREQLPEDAFETLSDFRNQQRITT